MIFSAFLLIQKSEEKIVIKEQNNISGVPLPQKEDVVRLFFNLVDEGRVSEAVMMMTPDVLGDESIKQAWGVQLNAFEDVKVINMESSGENIYKVYLETKMKPEAGLAESIPFYGYGDGLFTRWVELEEVDGIWKIKKIATGP